MKKTTARPAGAGFGLSWGRRTQGLLRISALAALCLLVLVSALTPSAFSQNRGPKSVADLAEKLQDAVVNISTTQTLKGTKGIPLPRIPKGSPFEEFFEDFFDRQRRSERPRKVNSLGSGFVIDSSGLIVTNNHVIDGAEEIYIKFSDDTKLKVEEVVGTDPKTDLALLRVKPVKPLNALEFGDSAKMRVGDWVMAIGNPFGLGGTVTLGIISAKKRDINSGPYDEFIQTDAAINRGNSGGPLFDMEGKVIGVNTAIISPSGGSIGIGFAVPSKTAIHVIDQLRRFGETRRGWLGVHIQSVTDGIAESLGMDKAMGALVANVAPDSPAEKSGMKVGDVVLSFDGTRVDSMRNLPRLVARTAIGKTVEIEILRDDKKKTLKVTIAKLARKKESAKAEIKETEKAEKITLLGLSLSPMSAELRSRFKIKKDISGVVITEVDPDSDGAKKKIKPGNVIVEVKGKEFRGKKVQSAKDVEMAIQEARKSGRSSVLLLIASGTGGVRFVALSLE